METNTGSTPSAADAQESLDAISRDRDTLARRIRSPRWYHPGIGVATALIVLSATPFGAGVQGLVVALALLLVVALVAARRRATGVTVSHSFGPAGRGVLIGTVLVLFAWIVLAVLLGSTVGPAWALLPALGAFGTTTAGGLLHDRVSAGELRRAR